MPDGMCYLFQVLIAAMKSFNDSMLASSHIVGLFCAIFFCLITPYINHHIRGTSVSSFFWRFSNLWICHSSEDWNDRHSYVELTLFTKVGYRILPG